MAYIRVRTGQERTDDILSHGPLEALHDFLTTGTLENINGKERKVLSGTGCTCRRKGCKQSGKEARRSNAIQEAWVSMGPLDSDPRCVPAKAVDDFLALQSPRRLHGKACKAVPIGNVCTECVGFASAVSNAPTCR